MSHHSSDRFLRHRLGEKLCFSFRRTLKVRLHSDAHFSSQSALEQNGREIAHEHDRKAVLDSAGFTLVELLVTISVVVVLFAAFGTFFTNYLSLYFGYQKDGSNFTELASQSERISEVLRGLTDISSASANDLQAYAYFSPADTYTSFVHYYLNSSSTAVMVDVTRMTANPPTGTLIAGSTTTYTVITNYFQPTGGTLFTYYDAGNNVLTPPIANEHTITEIGVNLAEPGTHTKNGQALGITVALRNRKINL